MNILLLYDNFVRDFRGLLLLKEILKARGHNVWIKASWNDPFQLAKIMNVDVIVTGQIAETATYRIGAFAKEHKIRLVISSTENVSFPKNFGNFLVYKTNQLNEDIIDLQTIATRDLHEFIQAHSVLKSHNKPKYKFIGFQRLDLTCNDELRNIEKASFRERYNLNGGSGKVYLFISSFLFDSTYEGIPKKDLDKWNIDEIKRKNDELLAVSVGILDRMVRELMRPEDTLLIKKHPWDCTDYFATTFQYANCRVVENTEYILPCIVNADVILHTYSTSAIEAWVLNKPTISIVSKESAAEVLNHMVYELTVANYEELKAAIENYPKENPSKKALSIFEPFLDGNTSLRLADEIERLGPNPERKKKVYPAKSVFNARLREWLYDAGLLKLSLEGKKPHTKVHDLFKWENERSSVIRRYKKHLRRYAKSVQKVVA
jgi:surface carbohydrate biosynthesis protein